MAIWSVLTKELSGESETRRAERVVFLREKFSFAAFLFAPLVLLRFRLWLAFAGYVGVIVAVTVLDHFIGTSDSFDTTVVIGLHLLVALELSSLRNRKLRRIGYMEAGVVVADTQEAAERRFFANYEPAPTFDIQRPRPPRAGLSSVIGSFPEARPS
ncbi:DUF2628 domain-containing protein [Aquabacter sp. CN5-332]|uniref:DUF2628 domain-containing protein n=1 Tax=Aquabacter sp. CN5-332 TaxID=3156608 RepID=UPI0032B5A360